MMMRLKTVLCFAVVFVLLVATPRKLEHVNDCLGDLEEEPGRQQEEKAYTSQNTYVWNDDATYEKTPALPERMDEGSLFVEETGYLQKEEVAGYFETLLDDRMFKEEPLVKEEFGLERKVEEKGHLTERRDESGRQLGSLFLHWLCENRGIVLARELEEKWYGNKHSMEKEPKRAVDCGFELSPKLSGAQGLEKELSSQTGDLKSQNEGFKDASFEEEVEVDNLEAREEQNVKQEEVEAADKGRLEAPFQVMPGLIDRSCGPHTKERLDLQKEVQHLERQVQYLRDLLAYQEERLKEEKEKNENFENMIVELGDEKCLYHKESTRDVATVKLKRENDILCEVVLALRNNVAELEDANEELKGDWQLPFIWVLPLACFMLLRKWLPDFTRLNYGGDELGEEGVELTRIN